jgi:Tol biopolymer transport system component
MKTSVLKRQVIIIFVSIFFIGLAALLIARFAQPPTIPTGTPSGELVFLSNRDSNWEIYALDSQGNIRNLSNDPAGDYFASWSLDGQQVNFVSARTGELGPTQVKPDGSDPRSLDIIGAVTTLFFEGRLDWDAQWSPDGTQVAYVSLRDLNLEIYVMGTDGENVTRLTNNSGRDWFPSWSPDSQKILFGSDREGDENLYVMDSDGQNLLQLTSNPEDDIRGVWSLDGAQILFASEREHTLTDGLLDLYMMNADGSEQAALDGVFEGGLVPSPDNSQRAYMSNREGRWHIYITDGDCDINTSGCVRRVTQGDADHLFPTWRPS